MRIISDREQAEELREMSLYNEFEMNQLQHTLADAADTIESLLDKLEEYKNLEEQGKLLKLPCEIGQRVYMIYQLCEDAEWEIEEHKIRLEDLENIGKTVFLTREEAKIAIAKEKQNRSQKGAISTF